MAMKVIDVLLIQAHDDERDSDQEETREVLSLMSERVALTSDNSISVGWDSAFPDRSEIVDCCMPSWNWSGKRGFHPVRQFATHFALINEGPAKPDEYNWDPDQRLQEFVALSRVVHPSSIGFSYCARLKATGGSGWNIIPASNPSYAYTNNPRTFLRLSELRVAATLAEKWRMQKQRFEMANGRIANALWWREKAAQEYYLEARWPLLITAIECLIKLWRKKPRMGSTKNFVHGMRMLAKRVGKPYSQREAKKAYAIRSTFAHGGRWPVNFPKLATIRKRGPETVQNDHRRVERQWQLYEKTEAVLDGAIRLAIENDQFGGIFQNRARLASQVDSAIPQK